MLYTDSYELLTRFGHLIVDEMKELFEPGSAVVIPFYESMLKDICKTNMLDYDKVVSEAISYFKHERINNRYCNLAVCAFQVMIAYKCVAAGNGAYNEALSSFLSVKTEDLQQIYSEGYPPKQERLWKDVKNLLQKQCDLKLLIPDPTKGSGRYVQYPRRQQLFTMGEYNQYEKQFTTFRLSHNQTYSYKEFADRVFSGYRSVCTNQNLKSFDKYRFENIARRVVFYCFCNWVEKEIRKRVSTPVSKSISQTIQDQYSVQIDIEKRTFSLIKNGKRITSYKNEIPYIVNSPFLYDEIFDNWNMTQKIHQYNTFGVCVETNKIRSFSQYLNDSKRYTSNTDSSVVFFVLSSNSWDNIPPSWKQKEKIKDRFVGGLKDETGAWIPGILPFVVKSNKTQKHYFYIDSQRINIEGSYFDLNDINLCTGLHILKFPDETPIALRISEYVNLLPKQGGWIWDKKTAKITSVSDGWIISGLNISRDKLYESEILPTYSEKNSKMQKISTRFDKMNMTINRFEKLGGINGK